MGGWQFFTRVYESLNHKHRQEAASLALRELLNMWENIEKLPSASVLRLWENMNSPTDLLSNLILGRFSNML